MIITRHKRIEVKEMTGILKGIDDRTNLAGTNRLELLIFDLGTEQKFGINVFKIQEVIQRPKLT
tara:strand:- start:17525 stop:17716 length:192 start_codon:yes stop_codon:yes gene_type:complete